MPKHFFPKNDVLTQPKDAAQTKPKFRIPPKQEVKTDTFQGIQLKPVSKDPKQPQQAENGKVDLKVAPLKGGSARSYCKSLCRILCVTKFLF